MSKNWPTQAGVRSYFGEPGSPQATAGMVDLPYPMKIAWDKNQIVRRFRCHAKVEAPMERIFQKTLAHYGQGDVTRLGLDIFGGCYNYRPLGAELPVDVIVRARRRLVRHGRLHALAANDAGKAYLLHQARHRAARDVVSLALHLSPHLAHAVNLEVLVEDTLDLRHQDLVSLGARRRRLRLLPATHVLVVGGRGDLDTVADRLDPVDVSIRIDEAHLHFCRQSSSAWAKYADALRRISFACLSSRFSRSSCRSRSSEVNPGRWPASRSDCFTQLESVCAVQPNLAEIKEIAAHSDG